MTAREMSHTSYDVDLHVWYDYEHQAWVKDGAYVRCGHPDTMRCTCYGRLHAGERAPEQPEQVKA